MSFGALVFILSLAAKIRAERKSAYFKIEEKSFLFCKSTISKENADSLLSCSQMCAKEAACKSANFIASQRTCSLLGEEQTDQPKNLLKRDGSFYLEKVRWQSVVNFCRQAYYIAEKKLNCLMRILSDFTLFWRVNFETNTRLQVVLNATLVVSIPLSFSCVVIFKSFLKHIWRNTIKLTSMNLWKGKQK